MKTINFFFPGVLAAASVLLLAGCQTRSISNSGYQPNPYYGGYAAYRDELNEFDVLDIDRAQGISEQEISQALDNAKRARMMRRGSSVLLIQSGAGFPDEPMITEINKYFTATPLTGEPERGQRRDSGSMPASYGKALRLVAARGGNETIVCYWGILESAREGLASKPVSWVPIAGWSIPDETQSMRIRLKAAIIDVRTGSWSIYRSEPIEEKAVSGRYNRESSDQRQVLELKNKAYAAMVNDLVKIYTN